LQALSRPIAVERTGYDQAYRVGLRVLGLLLTYLLVKLVLIPRDPSVTSSMAHDGGYICIVAEQLLAGQGFVNPGHCLWFLNPDRLPIPFHNQNPGYPTAVAGVAWLFGIDVVRAAIMVSILASGLLAGFVYLLVRSYRPGWQAALSAAVAVLAVPFAWQLSSRVAPDVLTAALSIGAIAVLCAPIPRPWNWIAAGVLFGLAWLVRST